MEEAGGVVVKGGVVRHLGVEFLEASVRDTAAAVLQVLAETHAAVMVALMVVAEALALEGRRFAVASVSASVGTEVRDDGGGHWGLLVSFELRVSSFELKA